MNRRALVDYERAIADYDRAIDLGVLSDGDLAVVFASLGDAHRDIRRYDQAIANYGEAIDLGVLSDGELAIAFSNRGDAHYKKGRYDPAIADFDRSIRLDPDQTDAFDRKAAALNDKAWTLATSNDALERDGVAAVCLAREAVRLNDGPALRDTLAAAHAEAGQFDDAVAEQERAIEMLRAAGQYDEIADYQTRLDLYRRRQPYRD